MKEDKARTDLSPNRDPKSQLSNTTNLGSEPGSTTGMPGWVKVSGLITIVLVILIIVLHLTGNSLGGHIPQ